MSAVQTEPVRWAVGCGCDGHGDHMGCRKSCRNWGCAHPVGMEITVATEAEADVASGQRPTPQAVILAAYMEASRIQSRADKKIARLHRVALRASLRAVDTD